MREVPTTDTGLLHATVLHRVPLPTDWSYWGSLHLMHYLLSLPCYIIIATSSTSSVVSSGHSESCIIIMFSYPTPGSSSSITSHAYVLLWLCLVYTVYTTRVGNLLMTIGGAYTLRCVHTTVCTHYGVCILRCVHTVAYPSTYPSIPMTPIP